MFQFVFFQTHGGKKLHQSLSTQNIQHDSHGLLNFKLLKNQKHDAVNVMDTWICPNNSVTFNVNIKERHNYVKPADFFFPILD